MGVNVEIITEKQSLRRGLVNNSTSASFPSIVPTVTKPATVDSGTPTGNALIVVPGRRRLVLHPFGTGDDNSAFDLRVLRWRQVPVAGVNTLWVPSLAVEATATLSTAVGVAGAAVINTERFADGLAVTPAPSATTRDGLDYRVVSNTSNIPGLLEVDCDGAELIGVYFNLDSATAANVLWSLV